MSSQYLKVRQNEYRHFIFNERHSSDLAVRNRQVKIVDINGEMFMTDTELCRAWYVWIMFFVEDAKLIEWLDFL